MKRTRVKICGITRPDDGLAAVDAGADAIGLVFWEHSSRVVTVEQARQICERIPAFVAIVALTVNARVQELSAIIEALPITLLQFHGDESPEYCQRFNRPYIKAIRVKPELDLGREILRYSSAQGVLLDAYDKHLPGGTGRQFNWELIPKVHRQRIILAGGLNADNVQQAIMDIRPYAVDVSGGVELSPGIKDSQKIKQFIAGVRQADQLE